MQSRSELCPRAREEAPSRPLVQFCAHRSEVVEQALRFELRDGGGQFLAQLRKVKQAGWNLLYFHQANLGEEKTATRKTQFPYGVSIALGFYAYFLFGGLI